MIQVFTKGDTVVVRRPSGTPDRWKDTVYECRSTDEARRRALLCEEALTWVGTPFVDCADKKGRSGGVDCAMLLTRSAVDSGLVPPFDPRPYSPRWHLHRNEQKFLTWLEDTFHADRVTVPQVGDIGIWWFGKCFSHCGIILGDEVVHAYHPAGCVLVTPLNEPLLCYVQDRKKTVPRPSLYFDVVSKLS